MQSKKSIYRTRRVLSPAFCSACADFYHSVRVQSRYHNIEFICLTAFDISLPPPSAQNSTYPVPYIILVSCANTYHIMNTTSKVHPKKGKDEHRQYLDLYTSIIIR